MEIIERYTVLLDIDNGAGDSCGTRPIGPFTDKAMALNLAHGNGVQGRDAKVSTTFFVTEDGQRGYEFSSRPSMVEIPADHPISKILAVVPPEQVSEILKTFR